MVVTASNDIFFALDVHGEDDSDVLAEFMSLDRLHHVIFIVLCGINGELSVSKTGEQKLSLVMVEQVPGVAVLGRVSNGSVFVNIGEIKLSRLGRRESIAVLVDMSDSKDKTVAFLEDLGQAVGAGVVAVDVTEGAAHQMSVVFRVVGHLDNGRADLLSSSVLHGGHFVSIVKVDGAVRRARDDEVVLLVVDIGAVVEADVGRDLDGSDNGGLEGLSLGEKLVGKSVDLFGKDFFKGAEGFDVEGDLVKGLRGTASGIGDLFQAEVADVVDLVEKLELDGFKSELNFTNKGFVSSGTVVGDLCVEKREHW